jgi:hypothetical protein
MTAPAMPRRYVLGAPEARSVLGRREPGEVSVLVGGVLLGLLASLTSGGSPVGFLALLAFVLIAVVAVYAPFRGRTLYRWLPVDVVFRHRQLSGRDRYRSRAREVGVDVASGMAGEVAPPEAIGRVTWHLADTRLGELAVLVQADGRVTACIEIDGPGLGLADGLDQEVAGRRWGTLLRDLANSGGLVQRVSLLERRLDAAGELTQTALVVASGDSQQYALDLDTGSDAPAPVLLPVAEDDDEGLVIRPAAAQLAADGPATP